LLVLSQNLPEFQGDKIGRHTFAASLAPRSEPCDTYISAHIAFIITTLFSQLVNSYTITFSVVTMSHAEPTQPLPIAGEENVPVAPNNTDRTLVVQPLRNFDYTEVRWSFDMLKPCGIRDRKLRHYRSQAATVLGQVYDRDPLC
jgi:hypothetical protein